MKAGFRPILIALSGIAMLAAGIGVRNGCNSGSTQFDLSSIPWCSDQHGSSTTYPCKWDSRERVTTGWDSGVPPVALYVRRSQGCPLPVPPKVSCYWAPQDQ
jgi:hypothetical protein